MLGMFTLIVLDFLVLIFNPAIPITRAITDAAGVTITVHGAFAPARRESRSSMASARSSPRTPPVRWPWRP